MPKFVHDANDKVIRRAPLVDFRGIDNPSASHKAYAMHLRASPEGENLPPATLAASSGIEISTNEYRALEKYNRYFLYRDCWDTEKADQGDSVVGENVLDAKADDDYLYVLWAGQDTTNNLYVSKFDKDGKWVTPTITVATNDTYYFYSYFSVNAANYYKRTAELAILGSHIVVVYRHIKVAGTYSPVFSGGTNDRSGIMMSRITKDLSLQVDYEVRLPETARNVQEVSVWQRETLLGAGVLKLAYICNEIASPPSPSIRYNECSYNSLEALAVGTEAICKQVGDFGSTSDIAGLPQAVEVDDTGSPVFRISYSLYDNGSGNAPIKMVKAHDRTGNPLDEATLINPTATGHHFGPPPYYLLAKHNSDSFCFIYYNQTNVIPINFYWVFKSMTLSATLNVANLHDLGSGNDIGGKVMGCWVSSSGIWDNAYFVAGFNITGDQLLYDPVHMHISEPLTGAPTHSKRVPTRHIGRSSNYFPYRLDNIPFIAHDFFILLPPDSHMYVSRPMFGAVMMECDLGNTESYRGGIDGWPLLTAKGSGVASLEFGDLTLNDHGIQLLVWNPTANQWDALSSAINYKDIYPSFGQCGVGLKYDFDPDTYLVTGTPDKLYFMALPNSLGELRDPNRIEVSYMALQPLAGSTAIMTTKSSLYLSMPGITTPPKHIQLFMEMDHYDIAEREFGYNGGADGTYTDLKGPLTEFGQIIAPFYVNHEENFVPTRMKLYLKKTGSPTDTHNVEIRRYHGDSGIKKNIPKDLVWGGTFDPSGADPSGNWFNVEISGAGPTLEPGIAYCVVITRLAEDGSNFISCREAGTFAKDLSYFGKTRAGGASYAETGDEFGLRIEGNPKIDKTMQASRDGGTSWKTMTPNVFGGRELDSGFDDGTGGTPQLPAKVRYLIDAYANMEDQPSDTEPLIRVELLGQPIDIRTLGLHWK